MTKNYFTNDHIILLLFNSSFKSSLPNQCLFKSLEYLKFLLTFLPPLNFLYCPTKDEQVELQNIYQRGIYHPKLLKLFAEVSRKSNKKSQSYEAMSDFYALRGEYGASLDQLRLAKSHVKINSTKHARILEKMNDIKLLQEEIVLR